MEVFVTILFLLCCYLIWEVQGHFFTKGGA
jgi:hypothetical protein